MQRKRARMKPEASYRITNEERNDAVEDWLSETSSHQFDAEEYNGSNQIRFFNNDDETVSPQQVLTEQQKSLIREEYLLDSTAAGGENDCGSYFTRLFMERKHESEQRKRKELEKQKRREQRNAELHERSTNEYARKYRVTKKDPATAFQLKLSILNQMTDDEMRRQHIAERRDSIRSALTERQRQRELVCSSSLAIFLSCGDG